MTVYAHLSPPGINIYSNLTVSYEQVTSRSFQTEKLFCKLTLERNTGTPAFQKTGAKKIKKMQFCPLS